MNICVTGGAGYIGSVLTERLLNLHHRVTVVDTFLHGYHGIMRLAGHPLLKVVDRDIRNSNRDYLNDQDVVFHLAAKSGIKICEADKQGAWEVNRNATAEITKNLHRDTVLIFTSTTAMYGDKGGFAVADEVILHSVNGVYSQTKLDAEKAIQQDDNTIILRLGTVYGLSPLMRPNSIVNDFVRMAVQDKRIVLYDDLTTRPYIHIQECVDGLIFAMNHVRKMNGKRYNLAAMNCSKRDIVDAIRRQVEYEIILSADKSEFRQDFKVNSLGIKALGLRFHRVLFHGLRDLIKLYSFYRP